MIITLKVTNRKLIKQVFNQNGHGVLIMPIKTKIEVGGAETIPDTLQAQDIINEVSK